ncbi:MAG: DsbA family protein [Sphingomonadaceae bacterium]|nr:DsbA family protein [Sphingomonadaceae bacterium]
MRFLRLIAMLAGAAALVPAGTAIAAPKQNWTATVTVQDDGTHLLGNPDADIKLTEFVSYTCPHCATFQKQADAPMRLAYIMPGKLSVRIHHVIRDPVDLAVAMLTNCGDPAGFFMRHHIFLQTQENWLTKMGTMSAAQRKRWSAGEVPARLRAVATDLDFYAMMAHRGYQRSAVDRCLSDRDMAMKLIAQTSAADPLGVKGTPSFSLDGVLLAAVHDWASLNIQIKARL